jgi:hypothetical protein
LLCLPCKLQLVTATVVAAVDSSCLTVRLLRMSCCHIFASPVVWCGARGEAEEVGVIRSPPATFTSPAPSAGPAASLRRSPATPPVPPAPEHLSPRGVTLLLLPPPRNRYGVDALPGALARAGLHLVQRPLHACFLTAGAVEGQREVIAGGYEAALVLHVVTRAQGCERDGATRRLEQQLLGSRHARRTFSTHQLEPLTQAAAITQPLGVHAPLRPSSSALSHGVWAGQQQLRLAVAPP